MQLKNEFEIDADLDRTWALLTDFERIAPCLPGAALDGRDGDDYLGNVKVKVGPIGAHFTGTARFEHRDDAARAAVISARGKDPKGQATATAQIHARLEPVTPTRTRVLLDTQLDISGRMAQFGRGAIADISTRLIGQFVTNLSRELLAPAPAPPLVPASSPLPTPAPSSTSDGARMDVLRLVLPMVRDRYGQAIAGGLLGLALSWLAFGRRARR
ncbi:SRPBCC family protein [Phytohabitans suffuscus]|uniref:Carbon monoxide dehydrogenase subunit G n=1 Tax=Phytohabitans suffuscus TaxID=624315 RepID=A0A6F8YRS0_9ACTN|nr:SRPBCC family protein [Phytohabitans suffuscus]BCB88759.1 carbon monoxide dehydrogenase subunit G [Phytohabitans suffuscus]